MRFPKIFYLSYSSLRFFPFMRPCSTALTVSCGECPAVLFGMDMEAACGERDYINKVYIN